jgi:hypothetical protein
MKNEIIINFELTVILISDQKEENKINKKRFLS